MNRKHDPNSRASRSRRGQSLVEFALVIPLFMLIFCGICDLGFGLFSRMSVINAARDGARSAVMVQDHSTIPGVAAAAAKSAAAGGLIDPSKVTVNATCLLTNPTTGSVSSPATINCALAVVGDSVLVVVHYPYKAIFPLLLGASLDLSSSVQMVIDT